MIADNWFDSIGFYDFGYAVSLRTNFYANVTDNLMTRVQSGLDTNAFSGASGPASWLFQGNTVQAYGAGVWDNLQFNGATSLTISDDTISSLTAPSTPSNAPVRVNYDGQSIGILLASIQDSVGVTITNNTISGMGYGVTLYNTTTSNTITIGGTNTITGNGVGVYLTNIVQFNPVTTTVLGGSANNPTGIGTANLTGLSLSNDTTGVLVNASNASTTFGVSLVVGSGDTISGGTTGLTVNGALASIAGNTLGNLSFTGQSGNYITLATGAEVGQTIDATSVTFGGTVGHSLTLSQAFPVEDKITDAIDATGLGFVRIQSNHVFVTPNSYLSPATDDTGALQRAIGVASSGDTVNVEAGTYTDNLTISESLSVIGAGSDSTTVNAGGGVGAALSGSNTITLQGLAFISGSSAITSSGLNTLSLIDVASSGNGSGGTLTGTTGTVNLTALAGETVSADALAQTFGTGVLQSLSYAGSTLTHLNLGTLGNGNTFDVKPATGAATVLAVDGGTPFPPGSTLNLDLSAVSIPIITPTGPGAGFLSTVPMANPLSWVHIGNISSISITMAAVQRHGDGGRDCDLHGGGHRQPGTNGAVVRQHRQRRHLYGACRRHVDHAEFRDHRRRQRQSVRGCLHEPDRQCDHHRCHAQRAVCPVDYDGAVQRYGDGGRDRDFHGSGQRQPSASGTVVRQHGQRRHLHGAQR